jgi:hypothetical protein
VVVDANIDVRETALRNVEAEGAVADIENKDFFQRFSTISQSGVRHIFKSGVGTSP